MSDGAKTIGTGETLTTGTGDTGNAYCPECMCPGVGVHYDYCPRLKDYTSAPVPITTWWPPGPPDYTDQLERLISVLERIALTLGASRKGGR